MQHRVHILLLTDGLGLHGPSLAGDADHVLGQLTDALGLAAAAQADDVADVLLVDGLALGAEGQQGLHGLFRQHDVLRLTGDDDLTAPVHHLHLEFRLQQADILIEGAKQIDGLLHAFNADSLFHMIAFFLKGKCVVQARVLYYFVGATLAVARPFCNTSIGIRRGVEDAAPYGRSIGSRL